MKRIYVFIVAAVAAAAGVLAACHGDDGGEGEETFENREVTVGGTLESPSGDGLMYDDCKVLSLGGESAIENGRFEVGTYVNDKVQTFVVQNNDEVYLMNRTPVTEGQAVELSVRSSALAMVTMHPLFSPVGREDYERLTALIEESPEFQAFYDEVAKAVSERRNLYDGSNEEMLVAFSNLMAELCGETEGEGEYDDTLDDVDDIDDARSRSLDSRAIFQHSQINPTYIDAQIDGRRLTLRAKLMTPSYYGTVSLPDGEVVNRVIPSRSDFGLMDFVNNRTFSGEPMEFDFSDEGNYKFSFSRMNAEATLDFYMRVASSILSTLGLSIDGEDAAIVESAKYIANAITAVGSGVSGGGMTPMDWLGIAYDAVLTQISTTGKLGAITFSQSVVGFAKVVASSWNWYNKVKGVGSFALRLAYAFDAPETIDFCLCYYDNEITTCTVASLRKESGDKQTGYAYQKLLLPLTVSVQTLGDDGSYQEASSYHRVKFEVVSGGGEVEYELVSADNNNQASTYWTLGESGVQEVKATVVDVITEKEISTPVYFTAEVDRAEVTIRLDWNKLSGDTDLDLHVVDPFGEEIAYYNMSSASGGYLDRDDMEGPGPEHVKWTDAPAGTYKIYVHYFPNEEEDRSVTSYKVSVTAMGVTYRPITGSIAYDQLVPIGQFTIGEIPVGRSMSSETLDDTEPVDKKAFPKKER